MKLLVLLWLLLATLIGLSIQQCTIEKAESFVNMRLRERNPENLEEAEISFVAYPNCLSTSKQLDKYNFMSISVLYNRSKNQSKVNEIRFDLECHGVDNKFWLHSGEINTAFISDTRSDCSDCRNTTVNDHHCTPCHNDCTGLNKCYGPTVDKCCNYNDGGNCTTSCGDGRTANSTFHCVEISCHNTCHNNGTLVESNCSCQCSPGYTGVNCEFDIDDCSATPCQHNGTCIDLVNNYICNCTAGYNGVNCENEIDECNLKPCQNNGTCIDLVNNYICNCTAGYNGTNCENEIDECDLKPCQNNGTCTDLVNNHICNCTAGYNGVNCENEIDECNLKPCQNNGTCIDLVNNYICNCTAGYNGTNCENEIDECDSKPCQNNGTCIDLVNNYTCNCTAGYNGTNCENEIDECDSKPCQNNGTCIDLVNNYTCNCTAGYNGTNCENEIDECDSKPCQNNGTCIDLVNNYTCNCMAGYNGTNCENEIDECDSKPCQNNGTCIDLVNNYTCNCMAGYNGTNCENEIDECDSNPCLNGGTCSDDINAYTCTCLVGYTGKNCGTYIICSQAPDDIELQFTRASYSVNENNGPAQPVLTLSESVDCCSTISVYINVQQRTAKEGEDYEVESSPIRVLFPGGTTRASFDVRMVDNVRLESGETFRVSIDPLSLPYGVVLGHFTSSEVLILDNDRATVSFETESYTINEQDGKVELALSLSQPLPLEFEASLRLNAIDDTTTVRCDYEGGEYYNVSIPVNVTMFKYNFTILDDDVYEKFSEMLTVVIDFSWHNQIVIGNPYTAVVIIKDDEEPITVNFSKAKFTVNEGDGVATPVLTLSKPSPCCLNLYVEVEDVPASAIGGGIDYGENGAKTQYLVTFPTGTNCTSFAIPINDDNLSEQNETFNIAIVSMSLPFGVILGNDKEAEVVITDNDIELNFSSAKYNFFEDEDHLFCFKLTLDKPALFDMVVEVIEEADTATRGADYESGPYFVNILKGNKSVDHCIYITDDNELEMDEDFKLKFNKSALNPNVIIMTPDEAQVNILDNEYVLCFSQPVYNVSEGQNATMTLKFSPKLPKQVTVRFEYVDLSAIGNETALNETRLNEIDYYTSYSWPEFITIEKGTVDFLLNIIIVDDGKLEDNELLRVIAIPPTLPDHHIHCAADLIIFDNDNFIIKFEHSAYVVRSKNEQIEVKLQFKFPEDFNGTNKLFPMIVTLGEVDNTATGGEDYEPLAQLAQNTHTFIYDVSGRIIERKLLLRPIDDNLVEPNETYCLNISVITSSPTGGRHVKIGEMAEITIIDDDVCNLRIHSNSKRDYLYFSKQLATNVTVNITYNGNQNDTVMLTSEQTGTVTGFTLPVSKDNIDNIEVCVPIAFESAKLYSKDDKITIKYTDN